MEINYLFEKINHMNLNNFQIDSIQVGDWAIGKEKC